MYITNKRSVRVIIGMLLLIIQASCLQNKPGNSVSKPGTPLNFGEKVPDYPMTNMANYKDETAHISDFKGKVLILDYWFTGCKPCIASWPKLLKLQEKFQDKIQIVLVNHLEDKQTVQDFMKSWEQNSGTEFTLPSVAGDTVLYKAMPPSGYPSIAWIDAEGIFKAFTMGADKLNEKNIRSFLEGETEKSITKDYNVPEFQDFDMARPLYVKGNGGDVQQMLWYSTVSAYSPKVRGNRVRFASDPVNGYGITMTHMNILELIKYAYAPIEQKPGGNMFLNYPRLPQSRYILDVKDSARYLDRTLLSNLYTYQLISDKARTLKQLKKKMQEDIQAYFDVDIRWEKRKKQCLVLKAEDTTMISDFNDERERILIHNRLDTSKETTREILNFTPTRFLIYLNETHSCPYPLIDETGFQGGLHIEYPKRFSEDYKLHKEFDAYLYKKYKMRFVLEEREIDMLVIRDSESYELVKSEAVSR